MLKSFGRDVEDQVLHFDIPLYQSCYTRRTQPRATLLSENPTLIRLTRTFLLLLPRDDAARRYQNNPVRTGLMD